MYQTQTRQSYSLEPTIYSRRAELGKALKGILGSDNVYYQRPENVKLKYPCILYELSGSRPFYADNGLYLSPRQYTITVIDYDPDSPIFTMVETLPMCHFDRQIVKDHLYNRVFTIYW